MEGTTALKNGVMHTLCRQCDQRCGIDVNIEDGRITGIKGGRFDPVVQGRVCVKAGMIIDQEYHPDRIRKPLKNNHDGSFVEIPYEQAMDEIAEKIKWIKKKYSARALGAWTGEAIGFNQQEAYARRFIHAFGSPNFTSADSVCFSSKLIGYSLAQGYWNSFPDFENSNVIILWGTNPALSMPPQYQAIRKGQKNGAKLIVVDPRRSAAARQADIWVRPWPGTDGALAWGIIHSLIRAGSYDKEFVSHYSVGFDKFAEYAKAFSPNVVSENTGVEPDVLENIVRTIEAGRPRIINFQGISLEHQTNAGNTARTLACLGGLCGAVDVEGGDPWIPGMKHNDLTLYEEIPLRDLDPVGARQYPLLYRYRKQCHSMTVMDYILGDGDYPLRGLIISGANPVLTNPNSQKTIAAFKNLDLMVSRELFLTKTAELADYILPAATFLGRSEIHYHPNPPRVSLTTKIIDVPNVTDEYTFWKDLAHRLGFGSQYFPWENEDEVNKYILEEAVIKYEDLKKQPQGLPYTQLTYLKYKSRPLNTPTGKFEFSSEALPKDGYPEVPEYTPPGFLSEPSKDYPLVLMTGGRKARYYHSRFRNFPKARKAVPAPEVEIHPEDANKWEIKNEETVRVKSKIGSICIQARIVAEDEILPGFLHITHGWDEANVNLLTDDRENCPLTGFPNLRAVPVTLDKMA